MPHLIWSTRAQGDVLRLRRFLWTHSPRAARKAVAAIREAGKLIVERPGIGRAIEGMPADLREWPVAFGNSGYLIRYLVRDNEVFILAIRHFREAGF